MTSLSIKKPRRGWLIPAIIAAVSFLGGAATEILGDQLREILSPYRKWVWIVFALAFITAIVIAIRESRKDDPPSNQDSSTIKRNVSAGQDIKNSRVITGDQNPTDTHGDVVYGTKIEQHVHQSETFVVSSVHQVPAPPQDFTGRVEEMEDLLANIEQGVTISGLQGLGGVGKTALALKLAEHLTPRYPDAQFYLDLKGTSAKPISPADAMAHVIRAYHPLAKLPDGEEELSAIYNSVLHEQRALLLMDNAANAEQIEPLLPPASCAFVVTSRVHFTLPGLYPKDINRMTADDARSLLIRIAPRIKEQADEIARLCGHLPLALRVAASAVAVRKTLTPTEYVKRLSDEKQRLSHLKDVDVALSVSYAMIGEEKQKLWRALAVFPNTFDHTAAAAVWEIEDDPANDTLGDLFVYSLVEYDEETYRYRLHDLARLFADGRLSEEESFEYRRRHSAHYQKVIKRADQLFLMGGESLKEGLTLFDIEWINAEAGHKWATANAEDERALELCDDYPAGCPIILPLRQHPRQQIVWLDIALKAARKLGRKQVEGWHLSNLGAAYGDLGEMRKAIRFFEQALAIAREIGDRKDEAYALGNLSIAYAGLGETRKAVEFYEQRLTIAREIGDQRGEGAALGNLGNAYFGLGETRKAIEFYEQALVIDREIGDRRGEGTDLWNMSLSLDELGERARAIECAEAALKIYEEIESPYAEKVREKLEEWRQSDEK